MLWRRFFRERGIPGPVRRRRLDGGEVNDNWRAESNGHTWVLRHYRRTADPAAIDCELAAVEVLGQRGFPTPTPVRATDGRRWDTVADRPAALFSFADGSHPPQRPGGYGSLDLDLGIQAARVAAQMHITLLDTALPGRRSVEQEPWRYIGAFLASAQATDPFFAELIRPLRNIHARLAPMYESPDGIPAGLIHNDITPTNILVDQHGGIAALLDFDDSLQTFLGYELGPIVGSFGCDEQRRIDRGKVESLVAAYDTVRPFTPVERDRVPDLLTAQAGAQGLHVLTYWLKLGRTDVSVADSYSARHFLELSDITR